MANITFIEANGQSTTLNLADGWSLMQGATANGVDGIVGECGGSCACATCHCYVAERRPNSRQACQIQAGLALEGAVVHLTECQE